MNKPLQFLFALAICLWLSNPLAAQRYLNEIFTDVTVTEGVEYAQNYGFFTGFASLQPLTMDVYEPTGDTETERPLVVWLHPGSFLPECTNTLPFGNNKDEYIVEMCTQFAKRGYVAAAINYRLGWNPQSADQNVRKGTIINAVYLAMQDAKAAVRYFKKDAATTNMFKIAPNRITVGGSNSGGYIAIAYSAFNKPAELMLPKFLNTDTGEPYIDMDARGDFDGFGGTQNHENHTGYDSDIQMVLNLGGAIGDTSWIEPGEVPIMSFHCTGNFLTPYNTGVVTVSGAGGSVPVVTVSGSGDLMPNAEAKGNLSVFEGVTGDPYSTVAASRTSVPGLFPLYGTANPLDISYEPWAWFDPASSACPDNIADDASDVPTGLPLPTGFGSKANPYATQARALAYIDTIMNFFAPRNITLPAVGINEPAESSAEVGLYPVPAQNEVYIDVKNGNMPLQSLELYDINGKLVRNMANINKGDAVLERSGLAAGIYFAHLNFADGVLCKKVIFR